MLEVDAEAGVVHLFVLTYIDEGFLVVGHGEVDPFCRIDGCRDVGEGLFDFLFYRVHVDVAHDDDALQVGTVPLVVVVADGLVGEVVDDVDAADGHTVGVLGVGVHHGLRFRVEAHDAAVTAAPLFVDDAAFLVYLLVFQQYGVAPVVQDEEAGVHDILVFGRHVADVIHRFVHTGIGVQVGSELDAFAFAPGNDARVLVVTGEVLGAVEAHVLQEVRQAALLRFFLNGTHLLGDVEFHPMLGQGVVADIIGQSVFQLADAYLFVHRDRRHLLGKCLQEVAAQDDGCNP